MIDTVIEDERWTDLERIAPVACEATLAHLGLDPARYDIVLLGADDVRIAALNGQFRGKARPTNVLSWPSEERSAAVPGTRPEPPTSPELGDIALAWETCAAEAERYGRSLDDHVAHLLVHGTLHLLGYDHESAADAELMESAETAILAVIGLPDPYAG
jgi:probable rRNA maturation factor